jgi:predicted pyridoxine 5'-phosphate oxidase superfamily flavin-nucleotide-binding protein
MPEDKTPFHRGELLIQERLGVRDRVHSYAPRVIRSYMPDQHRNFFARLPYFFIGSVDHSGQPWASVLWGEPGFVCTPTADTLYIAARPDADDPLGDNLVSGAELGMLGLAFRNRRRNRVNGRVVCATPDGFTVKVTQSFGNCPQYIQTREAHMPATPVRKPYPAETRTVFTAADRSLIEAADTLFIATVAERPGADARMGADMSHRGGKPGFVKILEDGSLLLPDFKGNNHFNTLGNIVETGRAGLLFPDFQTGDLLHLTGSAAVVWPEDSPFTYDGAQRYVRITPNLIIRRRAAMPIHWTYTGASPFLPAGTIWQATTAAPVRASALTSTPPGDPL